MKKKGKREGSIGIVKKTRMANEMHDEAFCIYKPPFFFIRWINPPQDAHKGALYSKQSQWGTIDLDRS